MIYSNSIYRMANTLCTVSTDIFEEKIIYYILHTNINAINYEDFIINTQKYKFDTMSVIKSDQYELIKNVWCIFNLICSCKTLSKLDTNTLWNNIIDKVYPIYKYYCNSLKIQVIDYKLAIIKKLYYYNSKGSILSYNDYNKSVYNYTTCNRVYYITHPDELIIDINNSVNTSESIKLKNLSELKNSRLKRLNYYLYNSNKLIFKGRKPETPFNNYKEWLKFTLNCSHIKDDLLSHFKIIDNFCVMTYRCGQKVKYDPTQPWYNFIYNNMKY